MRKLLKDKILLKPGRAHVFCSPGSDFILGKGLKKKPLGHNKQEGRQNMRDFLIWGRNILFHQGHIKRGRHMPLVPKG